MLSDARRSVPIIFLVTDGTVEDERQTCDMIKNGIRGESIFPRIYTLGIGIISLFLYIKTKSKLNITELFSSWNF